MLPFLKVMPEEIREDFLTDTAVISREISRQRGFLDFEVELFLFHGFAIKK